MPRNPIRLVGSLEQPRVLGVHVPSLDVTAALAEFGKDTAAALTDIVGYVFMESSPNASDVSDAETCR